MFANFSNMVLQSGVRVDLRLELLAEKEQCKVCWSQVGILGREGLRNLKFYAAHMPS